MLMSQLARSWRRAQSYWPGLAAAIVIAIAASFLGKHYNAPTMLFALLLGMVMNFLAQEDGPCVPGVGFAAKTVLRLGVALLGLRITVGQLVSLGWEPVVMMALCVGLTIVIGIILARLMGFNPLFGLLSGGAVAICGASAAMALSAALPHHPLKERATLFAVIGVSVLSTLAMIVYPMLAVALGLSPIQAGTFLGGTIHDVAQVVGAGYAMSPQTGDTATVVKLLRVAMLLPVILFVALFLRLRGDAPTAERPPLLPGFAVGFAALVAVNSAGWLPAPVIQWGGDASRWCLAIAISAIGVKTQIRDLVAVGWRPVVLMLLETLVLAGLVYFLAL
jgi:uncharacterized integral membrane protein (TIGR00698 family)